MPASGPALTCARCDKRFIGDLTNEQARAETITTFGVDPASTPDDFAVICDACFVEFMAWKEKEGL